MHQKEISSQNEKIIFLLNNAGFDAPTPFQNKVFPVFFQKKDIIAGTKGERGKRSSYIIPLLIDLDTRQNQTRAIIIVPEPKNVRKTGSEFFRYISKNLSNLCIAELTSDSEIKRELKALSGNPDVIIGTPKRIIDHIRRENIDLSYIKTAVVNTPVDLKENGFDQDLVFIFSKMPKKHQNIFYTDNFRSVSFLESMAKRPVLISMEDQLQENFKMNSIDEKINPEAVENSIKEFIESIESNESPEVLDTYKKLFKKYTPISRRGYLSAYLLKEACKGSAPRRRQRMPQDPDKTTLFISIGKNRKVYPKDLARLFQSRLDLEQSDIGTIKIKDSYSFLDISKSHADRAIEMLNGEEYKGRKLTVNHAKKRD
ncbi:MAG: DbpA RNA binding domain-containing protein [Spirochaetales bacterium]|nr:DbpA RNA binding domain-containing protein [Spirochaetales bacterium]